uniref:Secreted protein n=1 Tax=Cyanistes caeruleus TaxID=156563 RepID=A0A8C0ZEK2_CYACU
MVLHFWLLFPVQGTLQHQLREEFAVRLLLDVQGEVGVRAQPVGAHSISAHIGVLRALQGEARGHRGRLGDAQGAVSGGEARRVVIQIQDLHFQAEELQGVLCHHLHRQHAAGSCSAQTLAVQPLAHHQRAAVQAHVDLGRGSSITERQEPCENPAVTQRPGVIPQPTLVRKGRRHPAKTGLEISAHAFIHLRRLSKPRRTGSKTCGLFVNPLIELVGVANPPHQRWTATFARAERISTSACPCPAQS